METDIKKELRRDSNINAVLLLGFWLIYFLISFTVPPILKSFIKDTGSALFENAFTLIFYILLYPVGFSLLFLVFKKLSKKYKDLRFSEIFQKPQMPAGWTAKWIFLTIGATYASAYISSIFFMILEWLTKVELTEAEMSTDKTALGIITTVIAAPVFAPIFEELFFRGTLYRNVRKYGSWSMIIICGITFGVWHANYPQFLFASTMGIFSCFLFEKTKSIIPSMIIHFIINSIGASMMIFIGQLGIEGKDELSSADLSLFLDHPLAFLLLMLVGMCMMGFLITWLIFMIREIAFHPESFKIEKKNPEISEGKKFITYLSAPLMAFVMIAMLGLTVFRALGGAF